MLQQTIGFQRVIQRAVNHARSAEKAEVTVSDILASIFLEKDSHAEYFLSAEGITRLGLKARPNNISELQATAALQVGQSQGAGAALALAVAAYYAGQVFGPGIATFPTALPGGVALMASTFGNLELATSDRAQQIASACHLMAISTPVVNTVTGIPGPLT